MNEVYRIPTPEEQSPNQPGDTSVYEAPFEAAPNQPLQHESHVDDLEEEAAKEELARLEAKGKTDSRKFYVKMATGALALATAAGAVFGVSKLAGNSETVDAKPSTASAPVVPGPKETGVAAPQETVKAAPNPELWNEATVPILMDTDGDGKMETYEGVDAAVKAVEIKAEDYPTEKEAVGALIERINVLVNWGTNKEAKAFYSKYLSVNTNLEGAGGVGSDYINLMIAKALTAQPEGPDAHGIRDQSATDWAAELGALQGSVLELDHIATSKEFANGTTGYGLKFKLDGLHVGDPVAESDIKGMTINYSYDDNYDQTSIGPYVQKSGRTELFTKKSGSGEWNANMQIQNGVWKVVGNDYDDLDEK